MATSCAKTPPRLEPETGVEVPERWTAADALAGSVKGDWWTTFDDQRLDLLIAEALHRNRDLRAAAFRMDAAAAQARIEGAGQYPTVDVSGDRTRTRRNFVGFPIPGAEQQVLSTTSTTLSTSLDISWEADLWNRLRDTARAGLAELEASRADLEAARHSIAAQVARSWFALAEIQQQIELTRRTLESYRDSAERIRLRYESGLVQPLDLRLALTNVHDTEALLQLRLNDLQAAARSLEVVLGRYPSAAIDNREGMPELPPRPPAGIPGELLARRPDLVAAEWRLTSADARLASSRKALYPSFSFSASGGTAGSEADDLVDLDLRVWTLIGNLTQPIFQGGRLRANVRLSQAELNRLSEEFAGAFLSACSEVESALAGERLLDLRERELRSLLQQSQAALQLAENQYLAGLEDYITVLEAQRRALASETELISVRRRRLENRVDLHLALGGGFELPPDPGKKGGDSASSTRR